MLLFFCCAADCGQRKGLGCTPSMSGGKSKGLIKIWSRSSRQILKGTPNFFRMSAAETDQILSIGPDITKMDTNLRRSIEQNKNLPSH